MIPEIPYTNSGNVLVASSLGISAKVELFFVDRGVRTCDGRVRPEGVSGCECGNRGAETIPPAQCH
jgi:hypothetical protein